MGIEICIPWSETKVSGAGFYVHLNEIIEGNGDGSFIDERDKFKTCSIYRELANLRILEFSNEAKGLEGDGTTFQIDFSDLELMEDLS